MPDLGAALESVGVKRHVRFHDLRHTCASHLVSGSWGRAWTLEEVAKHLGHSSSAVTRRYAQLCPEGLARAVRETRPEQHLRLLAAPKQAPRDVPRCSLPRGMAVGDNASNVAESAEEKGFEPLVRLPPRRFSNFSPVIASGCTELQVQEVRGAETIEVALSCSEAHPKQPRDHAGDQARDHGTMLWRPRGAAPLAEQLLEAVAKGDPASLELASQLVEAVLESPVSMRAIELRRLIEERSPFALVRAIELAEGMLGRAPLTSSR